MSQLSDQAPKPDGWPALFAYGFRPFFLGAGIYALLAMLGWLASHFGLGLPAHATAVGHGHEMLFGYAAAVLAGFLLTAVPSWTGGEPIRGARLAALFGLWLAGRIAFWLAPALPSALVAAADLVFLPALALMLIVPLARAEKKHNLVFVLVLLLLTASNLIIHLERLGVSQPGASYGLLVTVDLFALLITVIGGRVIPSFTSNALTASGRADRVTRHPLLDRAAIGAMALLLLADLALPESRLGGAVALAAALVQAVRLALWRPLVTLRAPILWILHLSYGWLVVALAVKGFGGVTDLIAPSLGIHVLTIGAIGGMTLAFMTRASLGHTGRALEVHPLTVAAYGLISIAVLARVALPLADARLYALGITLSGIAWALAFALFAAVYAPILTRPRRDGRPG
jgi:uncharacterized protein involved in response to NO